MADLSLDVTWEKLHVGCDHILNLRGPMTKLEWMNYYSLVYNYCSSSGHERPVVSANQRGPAAHQITGQSLYNKLAEFLIAHVRNKMEEAKGQSSKFLLLEYYRTQWGNYTMSLACIDRIFNYINKWTIAKDAKGDHKTSAAAAAAASSTTTSATTTPVTNTSVTAGANNTLLGTFLTIYELGVKIWKEEFFIPLHDRILAAVLELVKKDRNEEVIDRTLLKSVIGSTTAFSRDDTKSEYSIYIEKPFMKMTQDDYAAEANEFVGKNSVVEYMKYVEKKINDEKVRSASFMDPVSIGHINRVCIEVFVTAHKNRLWQDFPSLLSDNRADDLKRMYSLLESANQLGSLSKNLEDHIKITGEQAVDKVAKGAAATAAANGAGGEKDEESAPAAAAGNTAAAAAANVDAKAYAETILAVHRQYHSLVATAFNNNKDFVAALDRACRQFINVNSVCNGPRGMSKSPELLAKYCDALLKKSAKNLSDAEMEEAQNDIMTIFRYIEEKDVFQGFYSRRLSARLITGNSASEDSEESMLNRLKQACGFEYTSKLQKMFTDIRVSADLNTKFQEYLNEAHIDIGLELNPVYVLTQNSWPLQHSQVQFALPATLQLGITKFEEFYTKQHGSRKLTWLHQQGKAELKTGYLSQSKIFQASLYQSGILLMFNNISDLSLTLENISATTRLVDQVLKNTIQSLVDTKVVTISDNSYSPQTKISLNTKFASKKIRIPINAPVKAEQKVETEITHKHVDDDRKITIQAAIVRIMKMRKSLSHQQIIQETIEQLKSRFQPSVPLIKQMIETLVEKEYLERHPDRRDWFNYLA